MARARQFQEAHELAKPSNKPSIRMAQAPEHGSNMQVNQLQPVLDGLQHVLQTVLEDQGPKKGESARDRRVPRVRKASGSYRRSDTTKN